MYNQQDLREKLHQKTEVSDIIISSEKPLDLCVLPVTNNQNKAI